ncbi:MAG: 50S ribosomal protein L4 [Acidobacteriota bacterium]
MAEIAVRNLNNDKLRDIQLPDKVFAYPLREHLIYEAVNHYLASGRSGTASTKNRVEISGGGRKPWRQKHTGRARVGSIRSPLWRGGGTIFGPTPRDYSYHFPGKMRKNALRSILSAKLKEGKIIVIDDITLASRKTKDLARLFEKTLGIKSRALIVYEGDNRHLELASRNNVKLTLIRALAINPYDLLRHEWLVLSEKALQQVNEVLAR